jgi:gliding motility-associated lipoprotein GldH
MIKKTGLFLSFSILFLLYSCSNRSAYEFSHDFSGENWQKFDTLKFIANINDGKSEYHILIGFDYSGTKAPTNVPLGLTIISPSGSERYIAKKIWLKTLEGVPKGIKSETMYSLYAPLLRQVYFNESGSYNILIDNQSDKYDTQGVSRLTLKILSGKFEEKPL